MPVPPWRPSASRRVAAGTRRTTIGTPWALRGPPTLVNAFLIVRDGLVDRLNDRSRRMLRRSLEGASQHQIAAEEGISASAVSQAFAKGVTAVRDAQRMFSPSQTPSP